MAGPGDVIGGRYRLVRELGAGGMGVVWEARDERLNRLVAIKQLRIQPGLPPQETAVAGERAMREARITASLHHPHAVAVFDVVEHEGSPCIVMELVPSEPLTEVLRGQNTVAPAEAARIGSQIAGALAAAHALGIVHRDVKPGNVLIGRDGAARICDFGISRAYGDSTLTMTGMITGTPAYLAPEVARGEDSTYASDVYSLGATLYAAVEGRPPSGTEGTPIAVLYRVAAGQVQPPERAGRMGTLLLQMLDADPAQRPSMASVSAQLASPGSPAAESTRVLPTPPPVPATTVMPRPTPPVVPAVGPQIIPPVDPPGGTTVQRPVPPARRGARPAVIAVVAIVIVVGLVLAALGLMTLTTRNADGPSAETSRSQTAEPVPSSSAPTSASAPPSSSTPPSSSAPSSSVPSTSPPASGATQAQLIAAVTDYYALLPDDIDAAWPRLTASYQRQTGGRDGYDRFWNGFDTVTVSDVRATGTNQVQAALVYVAKSGNQRSTERRSFQLVDDGGVLKINQSAVL